MAREQFQKELQGVQEAVLVMGSMTEQAVRHAVDSLNSATWLWRKASLKVTSR